MWRDSDGAVNTVALEHPLGLLPQELREKILLSSDAELIQCSRRLNETYEAVLDEAAEMPIDDERSFEGLAPSPQTSWRPTGGVLVDVAMEFLSSVGPRWRLDFLEILQDALDDASDAR